VNVDASATDTYSLAPSEFVCNIVLSKATPPPRPRRGAATGAWTQHSRQNMFCRQSAYVARYSASNSLSNLRRTATSALNEVRFIASASPQPGPCRSAALGWWELASSVAAAMQQSVGEFSFIGFSNRHSTTSARGAARNCPNENQLGSLARPSCGFAAKLQPRSWSKPRAGNRDSKLSRPAPY